MTANNYLLQSYLFMDNCAQDMRMFCGNDERLTLRISMGTLHWVEGIKETSCARSTGAYVRKKNKRIPLYHIRHSPDSREVTKNP